jgi:hypothetical protein
LARPSLPAAIGSQLFARPKTDGVGRITYNELSWCFMPRVDRTEKALGELERYVILKILRRVPEGFSFEIRSENEWRFVLSKRLRKTHKTDNETTSGEKEETAA